MLMSASMKTIKIAGAIVRELKSIGYRYVTLDLQGYRTGSLNEGLLLRPAVTLTDRCQAEAGRGRWCPG